MLSVINYRIYIFIIYEYSQKGKSHLEKNDISTTSIEIHKPTLDDVFLKLTGHGAEAKSTSEDDQ